jgi:hypothetical protein
VIGLVPIVEVRVKEENGLSAGVRIEEARLYNILARHMNIFQYEHRIELSTDGVAENVPRGEKQEQ